MIMLDEEGRTEKAKIVWKLQLVCQTVKSSCECKVLEGSKSATSVNTQGYKKAKQPYFWYRVSLAIWAEDCQHQHYLKTKPNPDQGSNTL